MLRLKRASAGSGKTYELAKTYIKLLLTAHADGDRGRQLRSEASLRDALSSIMAVTFTVKATAEMKQRIVEKLAALAKADTATPEELKKIHYLEEFRDDMKLTVADIARMARKALRVLLLHYSDFRVQTIDSFFQGILHTFAYEAGLDDNFNMEIDTDLVAAVGLDSALDSLTSGSDDTPGLKETLYWFRREMEGALSKRKWNVFARKDDSDTLYASLIKESRNLEKERYHDLREEMAAYFATAGADFSKRVKAVDDANFASWEALHEARRDAARAFLRALEGAGLHSKDIRGGSDKRLLASLGDIRRDNYVPFEKKDKPIAEAADKPMHSLSGDAQKKLKTLIAEGKVDADTIFRLDTTYDAWVKANNDYLETWRGEDALQLKTWLQYRRMIPRLMIVLEIAARKEEYLNATNSLQISDTNHILRDIIDGEEAPFIYERMGSRLDHYLIDEFQDTSRLQWGNLLPLLLESDANSHDNLIIGDAKQSIYRFRNADYRLIGEVASENFSKIVDYTTEHEPKRKGASSTNFRSKRRVVEFNNFLFSRIPDLTSTKPESGEKLFSEDVREIYSDCVQDVRPRGEEYAEGYVEVVLSPPPEKEEAEAEGRRGRTSLAETGYRELPERILGLRERGYRFSEIAVLVKSHEHGTAAMSVISRHNAEHPDRAIPVISEENLLVSSAFSIKLIIRALEMALDGPGNTVAPNPVLSEPIEREELMETLRDLPSPALPSVVEAIVERFVPPVRRNAEAPFIAAFQDAVIDYSTNRTSDIGSFLKWWKRKGRALAITSPEDSDGVRLQTIHKSKGLEYKCVILPQDAFSFVPWRDHVEWRWVNPSDVVAEAGLLPPWLPIETRETLKETAHADVYATYCEEHALDDLNKMYVAYTRAANELYVYGRWNPKGPADNADGALARLLIELGEDDTPEGAELPGGRVRVTVDEETGRHTITYGKPATPEEIKYERDKEERERLKEQKEQQMMETYKTNSDRKLLKVRDGSRLLKVPVHTAEGEEEFDPRAEGTLKHRIMQMVVRPSDLRKALLEMKTGGLVSAARVKEWGDELARAIESVADRGWFADDVRVISERPIMRKEDYLPRPDRVVVTPAGDAIVIDYKFGEDKKAEYHRKVALYARLLRESGAYRSVSAYLWYVSTGEVEPVE